MVFSYNRLWKLLIDRKMKKKELSDESARRAFVDSYDWNRMTAQDENVWERIFEFLDS